MAYIAPYLINDDYVPLPSGTFTVPVCTTPERFKKITNALWAAGNELGDGSYEHLVDWLDALSRITEGCEPRLPVCRSISPASPQITWFPESPYNPEEEIPTGYAFHPWTIVDSSLLGTIIGLYGFGYQIGDVYTDITKIPETLSWEDFLENPLNTPAFTINNLVGAGTVKIHFLNIPLGGHAIIQVDDVFDLLNLKSVELNKDLVGYPQETQTAIIVEVPVFGDGTHEVKVTFVPKLDDSLLPINFGGGIREIELCGFGGVDMAGEGCCDETNQLLGQNNELLAKIYLMMKKGFEIHPIGFDQPPDTISLGTCAPEKYDQDGSDDEPTAIFRAAVLCYVTYCYVMVILVKALSQMGMSLPTLGVLFPLYNSSPTALQKVKVEYPEVLSVIALITGIPAGGALIDLVVCQMVARLRGQFNTFDIFKNSLDIFGGVGTLAIPVSGLVNATNQNYDNWLAFGEALVQGMDMATEVDAYTCPCTQDCTTDLELQIVNGRGTFTKVEGTADLYHFTGAATYPVDVDLHGGVYIRDVFGRCMTVWMATDGETGVPVGWTDQGVLYHHVIGCCGTESSTGLLGGFAGVLEGDQMYTEFYWDRQDQAVDTYLHVKCFEC